MPACGGMCVGDMQESWLFRLSLSMRTLRAKVALVLLGTLF